MKIDRETSAMIDNFIATKGVTRCPPAAVAPGTALLAKDAKLAEHVERQQAQSADWKSRGAQTRKATAAKSKANKPKDDKPKPAKLVAAPAFFPGPKPEMAWLPVGRLKVDERYQRPLGAAHARRLAAGFKWAHFQPLTVAPGTGGEHWDVIDGQHRLQAALTIPQIAELPCYVVPAPSLREQATAFLAVNTAHRTLWAIDKFKAALAAGEGEAMAIRRILDELGIKLIGAVPHPVPMATRSVSTVIKAFRVCGPTAFREGLAAIAEAWPKEPEGFAESYISALPRIFLTGGARVKRDKVVGLLRKLDPGKFYRDQLASGRKIHKSGSAMVFAELSRIILGA